jgi:hypothetical protein
VRPLGIEGAIDRLQARKLALDAAQLGVNFIERVIEPIGHVLELAAHLRLGAARGRGRRE